MPKISVIVPVYKVEAYLPRCIDSILAQTFTDFELILVDDGSPDNCGAICDEYAAKDNRIHVIHKENGGLSSARNAGIDWVFANSNSEYFAFIDSDDWISELYLEKLYNALVESQSDLSICNFINISDTGVITKTELHHIIPNEVIDNIQALKRLDSNFRYVVAWNKLYKRKIFNNIRFPLGKLHEDEFTIHYFFDACKKIVSISDELYYYFYRTDSITKAQNFSGMLDGFEAIIERLEFLSKKNLLFTRLHAGIFINCKIQFKENLHDTQLVTRYNQLKLRFKNLRLSPIQTLKKYVIYYCPPFVYLLLHR